MEDPRGEAMIHFQNSNKEITAKYSTLMKFEHFNADVKVGLIKSENQWKIESFNINSDVFRKK